MFGLLGFLILLSAGFVHADVIPLTGVNATTGLKAYAADPVTGKYYRRDGIAGGTTVYVYDNQAAFEAGTSSGSITLGDGGFYGTYFEVNNGYLYARTDNSTTAVAKWNATTGARVTDVSAIPEMGGQNNGHAFKWGGYSAVNFMQDHTGMYIFSRKLDLTAWQLTKVDSNLNILESKDIAYNGTLGFAFMVGGTIFMGLEYNEHNVDYSFDFANGTLSSISHTLTGNSGTPYWSNTFYDYATDTLYMDDNSGGLFKAEDISDTLGVVPEPASIALLGVASAIGLFFRRRFLI